MANFSKIFLLMVGVLFCQQAEAATKSHIIKNAHERFHNLASNFFQASGYEKTISNINTGKEGNYQNTPLTSLAEGDDKSGGHVICVEEGKMIVGSYDPQELNRDVSKDPLITEIIAALKASNDEKVVVSYDNGKKTAVAWGRKALMGEKLDKTMHSKFFCYVTFDNPGS